MANTQAKTATEASQEISLKFRLQIFWKRLTNVSEFSNIFLLALLIAVILAEAGFIFNIAENASLFYGNSFSILAPKGINDKYAQTQTISESILVAILIAGGSLGLFLMRRATIYVDDPSRAFFTFSVAITLLVSSIIALYFVLIVHLGIFTLQ
jgi:hypothetical protein